MKFCFSTYATLLLKCKKVSVTQKDFIEKLISTIDIEYAENYIDESAISCFVRGTKNLSPNIAVLARECKSEDIADAFSKKVIPLIDQNKNGNLILAMKDLIAKDNVIDNGSIVEYVSRKTKKQLLGDKEVSIDKFLSGLFLYVVVNTKSKGTTSYVKEITDEFVSSFDGEKSKIYTENDTVIISNQPDIQSTEYNFDEDTLENARIFCLDHEDDLSLLPLCEMAAHLNPGHKHVRTFYTDFIRQKEKTQKAILIYKSIKPFEFKDEDWLSKCIEKFNEEINRLRLTSHKFLYEGAKYFHRAFEYYSDYKPKKINPFVFKRKYVSGLFPNVAGDLKDLISDYLYGKENYPDDNNTPPFDILWDNFNLGNCEENILTFWVCRFIIDVCHELYGFDINGEYDDNWIFKDCINNEKLTTQEDLYYYAVFMLYMSYCEKD